MSWGTSRSAANEQRRSTWVVLLLAQARALCYVAIRPRPTSPVRGEGRTFCITHMKQFNGGGWPTSCLRAVSHSGGVLGLSCSSCPRSLHFDPTRLVIPRVACCVPLRGCVRACTTMRSPRHRRGTSFTESPLMMRCATRSRCGTSRTTTGVRSHVARRARRRPRAGRHEGRFPGSMT